LGAASTQTLLVLSSPHFQPARARIAQLAILQRLPTMFIFKTYVEAGGLLWYGADFVAMHTPVSETPAHNVCAGTARKIEEVAERNRIREEAGLPLLSISKELRKIKNAEIAAEFEDFADQHRQAVWDEVLAPVREARGEPNWRPTRLMEGLAYQAQVNRILRKRFEVIC
jgi:predicted Fe-S protein YdhL (DUF1289 family)